MAKIFSAPEDIKQPNLDFANMNNYQKECDQYLVDLKSFLQKRKPNDKLVGETIKFPVADGYAQYMVGSISPLELVHIPLGDAWDFQYVHLLKKKDVEEKIAQEKAMDELFAKHRKK